MATNKQSVVGVYDSMARAEEAVQRLDREELPIKQISIVARNLMSENRINGFVTTGDVAKTSAGIGAWTGGIFGLLLGAAFLWVPGVGPLIVAGPLAAALVGSLEGAAAGGVTGALLGALAGWGISKRHILKYEQSVAAGKYLLVFHGTADEVARAKEFLETTKPAGLESHGGAPLAAVR